MINKWLNYSYLIKIKLNLIKRKVKECYLFSINHEINELCNLFFKCEANLNIFKQKLPSRALCLTWKII